MNPRETLSRYFHAFSNKDLDTLAAMFAEDVSLVDWNISAQGKAAVCEANRGIFRSVQTITATPVHTFSNSDRAFAVEIVILVNGSERLDVIDVIKFNEQGLIQQIEAFKK
ncbi:MAG: nuclear transport factor 2 family protein [Verrucomicrobiota bacterium]